MKAQLRTTKRGGAAALLIALLALGCLGRSPGVRQFTLGPVPGPTVAGTSSELVVTLGPLSFPPYLQRPQLVTRGDASELVYDERNRWAGGFESNVRRALADDLSERLGTPWVVFAFQS